MLEVRPPKADPLLAAPDVKAYNTSDIPWKPGFNIDETGPESDKAIAVGTRIRIG